MTERNLGPLAVLVLLAPVVAAAAAPMHQCSAPCLQAARGAHRECTSSAKGAFLDAADGCLERDRVCVDACRSDRQACRDSTGVAIELAACQLELASAKASCRDRFPPLSKRRTSCIDRAQVAGFRCRDAVRRRFRRALGDCRAEFAHCASGCGLGESPGGAGACRTEGRAAFKAVSAGCKLTFQVTSSGCVNKDVTCVQGCGEARDTCEVPTRETLEASVVACTAQEGSDVTACRAASPAGGPTLDQCIDTAKANVFTCRDAALDAAAPGLAVCAEGHVGCIRACPPA